MGTLNRSFAVKRCRYSNKAQDIDLIWVSWRYMPPVCRAGRLALSFNSRSLRRPTPTLWLGKSASLGLASTIQQTTGAGKTGIVVGIVVVKVFGIQSATKTFLKAADAKTATPRLQARSLPYAVSNGVDLGIAIDCLLNATPIRFESLLSFDPTEKTRRSIEAAINTQPTLRRLVAHINR